MIFFYLMFCKNWSYLFMSSMLMMLLIFYYHNMCAANVNFYITERLSMSSIEVDFCDDINMFFNKFLFIMNSWMSGYLCVFILVIYFLFFNEMTIGLVWFLIGLVWFFSFLLSVNVNKYVVTFESNMYNLAKNGLFNIHPVFINMMNSILFFLVLMNMQYNYYFNTKYLWSANYVLKKQFYYYIILLLCFMFFTLIMGSLWSYQEYGWKTWWAWDYVEFLTMAMLFYCVFVLHNDILMFSNDMFYSMLLFFFMSLLYFNTCLYYNVFNSRHHMNKLISMVPTFKVGMLEFFSIKIKYSSIMGIMDMYIMLVFMYMYYVYIKKTFFLTNSYFNLDSSLMKSLVYENMFKYMNMYMYQCFLVVMMLYWAYKYVFSIFCTNSIFVNVIYLIIDWLFNQNLQFSFNKMFFFFINFYIMSQLMFLAYNIVIIFSQYMLLIIVMMFIFSFFNSMIYLMLLYMALTFFSYFQGWMFHVLLYMYMMIFLLGELDLVGVFKMNSFFVTLDNLRNLYVMKCFFNTLMNEVCYMFDKYYAMLISKNNEEIFFGSSSKLAWFNLRFFLVFNFDGMFEKLIKKLSHYVLNYESSFGNVSMSYICDNFNMLSVEVTKCTNILIGLSNCNSKLIMLIYCCLFLLIIVCNLILKKKQLNYSIKLLV